MVRRLAVLAAVLAAVLVLAGGTAAGVRHLRADHDGRRGVPVYAVAPAVPVATRVVRHRGAPPTCIVATHGSGAGPSSGTTWLDPRPSGGELLWRPGLNSRHCRASLAVLDAAHARALVAAVDSAPVQAPGRSSCPMDDGSSVTAYLSHPGTAEAEVVTIELRGCQLVAAPGRSVLTTTTALRRALGPPPKGL